jgi:hypothetical protein
LHHSNLIEQGPATFLIDQNVDVAVRSIVSPCDRAEDAEVGGSVFVGDGKDFSSFLAELFESRHGGFLSTVFSLHEGLDVEIAKGCPVGGMSLGAFVSLGFGD